MLPKGASFEVLRNQLKTICAKEMATTVDISGDGGVIKEVLRQGTGNLIPARSKARGLFACTGYLMR